MNLEESEHQLHADVGRCLANWSKVEFAVATLYCSVKDQRLRVTEPALQELEALRTFDEKRKTLKKVVRRLAWTEGEFRESHRLVDKELEASATLRAQVAHFTVVHNLNAEHPGGIASLRPFYSFSGSYLDPNSPELSVQEVGERADHFSTLASRLFRLTTYVINVRGLLERHDPPTANLSALLRFPFVDREPMVSIVA